MRIVGPVKVFPSAIGREIKIACRAVRQRIHIPLRKGLRRPFGDRNQRGGIEGKGCVAAALLEVTVARNL